MPYGYRYAGKDDRWLLGLRSAACDQRGGAQCTTGERKGLCQRDLLNSIDDFRQRISDYKRSIEGMKVTLLGTGDAIGTPKIGCKCPACMDALGGGRSRRMRVFHPAGVGRGGRPGAGGLEPRPAMAALEKG